MIGKLLRNFAEENFDGNYYPVYHGKIQEIEPFVLLVKKPARSIWERPFKKNRYTVLAGMKTYVVTDKKQEFVDAVNENIKKEDANVELQEEDEEDNEGAARELEFEAQAGNSVDVKIKINENLGHLELGRIDQEYIRDPELRDILAKTKLNSDKTKAFEGCKLRLITSVIYSERFALKGHREMQLEVGAGAQIPNNILAQLKGLFKKRVIPPKMATRNTRGPFLFKCCRVVCNKETNQLELAEGEFVGMHVPMRGDQTVEEEKKEEERKEEYENTAVDLEEDVQSDLADANEDGKKWEKIIKFVLKPTKNREERKARVNKYLQWFESALERALTDENQTLTGHQRMLSFDQPLTEEDCKFLRHGIITPCGIGDRMVKLPKSFDEDTIQGYAIVLKKIAGLSDKDWDEVEEAWAEEA